MSSRATIKDLSKFLLLQIDSLPQAQINQEVVQIWNQLRVTYSNGQGDALKCGF